MSWYKQIATARRFFTIGAEQQDKTLREQQDKALRTDVERVLSCRRWINTKTNGTLDTTRIRGVVAGGKGAENYLPYTIPKIIQQISEIGMGADVVLGLNNGFECQAITDCFALLPNVQVIHLYTGEKTASSIPAEIFDHWQCRGKPYSLGAIELNSTHRVFVVHQKEGLYSAGKIRVLGDIYGSLFLKSIEDGWIPPAIMITFDAESQLLVNQEGTIPDLQSNGLKLIVNELQTHPWIDVLGAGDKYAVYRKDRVDGIEVLLPNFKEEIPPIQWFLNITHGQYKGYQWKPGGGTVGKTDVIISLLSVITKQYPGVRVEDVQLTILAQHAGFSGDIFTDVIFTNRVPNSNDIAANNPSQLAWKEQMNRWISGGYSLELNYGKHNVRSIVSTGFPWNILIDPVGFIRRVMIMENASLHATLFKILRIIPTAIPAFVKIKHEASKRPDLLQDPEAKASW